jgi:hypothetical protein
MKKLLCVIIVGVWLGTSACGKLATLAKKMLLQAIENIVKNKAEEVN